MTSSRRFQKYITYVRDKRFTAQRQLMLVDLLHDDSRGYTNQYARVETNYDLGSFDFSVSGSEGNLLFIPSISTINDYDIITLSYGLKDSFLGTGSTSLGGVVLIDTDSVSIPSNTTKTIVSIAKTYTSAKVLVNINPDISKNEEFESVELNITHNSNNVELLEYGRLTTGLSEYSDTGFGTYHAYIDGSSLKVDFIPTAVGIATTGSVNTITVGLSSDTFSGIGTLDLSRSRLEGRTTSISASGSPGITTVAEYPDNFDGAYFIAQVTDTTNSNVQLSEIVLVDDYTDILESREVYMVEYANIETSTGLGTFGSRVSAGGTVSLVFTPNPSINSVVNVYMNALTVNENTSVGSAVTFTNAFIGDAIGEYFGTDSDIKREFELTHKNEPIFERYFLGNNSGIISTTDNSIKIPNHFFVSGEKIRYTHVGATSSAIGIAATSFVGAANTTFLPDENLYAVKIDNNLIKIATSPENALKTIPEVVELASVGIGTSHRFISTNQNAKVIVCIDNIIQSPIVSTAITTTLADRVRDVDNVIKFSGITSFFGSDLIQIGSEIMKIEGVGIGSTNAIRVRRPWLGTVLSGYGTGTLVTKISGNYNIVDNILNFVEAPYGNVPIGSTTNPPDERDWSGITTGSSFQGRSFIRSGVENSSEETYSTNYIFDDISDQFNATKSEFTLEKNKSNITGVSTENGIILVNGVFQTPGTSNQYIISESSGISSIAFQGTTTTPLGPDVGISSFPKGGIIVSVASTEGFGYQPLISAGGTATISGLGTISSISIGNSGSGYRSGIQTFVNVGVGTSSTGNGNIEFIGTAAISGGNIVSVAITNPGSGYTSTNQPFVVFDDPLSYSDINLQYSTSSIVGVGTSAILDIVVGQGSSIIDFVFKNTGYGFGNGEILTIPVGGTTGIPTTSLFSTSNEFQITIDEIFNDSFSGWSVGQLQVLDDIDKFIDGTRRDFPLSLLGDSISIVAGKGSNINVQDVLLIFVNDILQVPGEGYTFNGGSIVKFTESIKLEDKVKIIFYRGTGDADVIFVDTTETVKKGDTLQINHDPSINQPFSLQEDERIVDEIKSTNLVGTNPYFGPGNTNDVTLERPVVWCKQTEDLFINQTAVGKDRELYEPVINPSAYIIKSVGVGSTAIYVDNLRPIFDSKNENEFNLTFQNKIKFISQESKISAAATAIVSELGTISSISISNGGSGYDSAPVVTIGSPSQSVGLGTTATATANITSGKVTSASLTNAGTGYTTSNPPSVLIEPHTSSKEICDVSSYVGDSGVIVGFGTTTINEVDEVIVDLHIPYESFLRDTDLVGTAVTLSSISVNDYFTIFNSNASVSGNPSVETFNTTGTAQIGLSTHFIDAVHQAKRVEVVSRNVGGISTNVLRVNSVISGIGTINFSVDTITMDDISIKMDKSGSSFTYSGGITTSNYFGEFSWGRINLAGREKNNSYTARTLEGIVGISTSDILIRDNSLKFKNYLV